MTDRDSHRDAELEAAVHVGRCRILLRERVPDDVGITTETIAWGNGRFRAKAFSTVWRKPIDPDTIGPFAREVVIYHPLRQSQSEDTDRYEHAVEHYSTGHHDEFYRHELGVIRE